MPREKTPVPEKSPKVPVLEMWPISRFKPYLNNPRKHSEAAVAQFAKAIQKYGFRIAVLVKSTGDVIDGHFRLKAAEHAGLSEVLVQIADDMTEEEIRGFRLSVNKMPELADWDQDPLLRELEALAAGGEKLAEDGPIGFELEEYDPKLATEDWDLSPTTDVFVLTITGSLPIEDEVRARLKGIEGITIEASSLQRSES